MAGLEKDFWRMPTGECVPLSTDMKVIGLPVILDESVPPGQLYFKHDSETFHARPGDVWPFEAFIKVHNSMREAMKSRHPLYIHGVREDLIEHPGALHDRITGLEGGIARSKLEINRLVCEKDGQTREIATLRDSVETWRLAAFKASDELETERVCMGESREHFEREIENLSIRIRNVRVALGPEWNGCFIEDAVAQLKRDHIESVRIADKVPGLEREIDQLNKSLRAVEIERDYLAEIITSRDKKIDFLYRELSDLKDANDYHRGRYNEIVAELEGNPIHIRERQRADRLYTRLKTIHDTVDSVFRGYHDEEK